MSRTERAIGPLVLHPAHPSPCTGAIEIRPREGLSPATPQHAAGILIEPPPSLPSAIGAIAAATAHAAPPLEPPAVRVRSHGLRVVGQKPPSVVTRAPNSGVLVLPSINAPAPRIRTTNSASAVGTKSW